uniref:hypothetical protein n=1 Tax=Hafnia alvei TaxID=569 RepID=UPI00242C28C6|nr:hypothetical protein [Hafnia alvei]
MLSKSLIKLIYTCLIIATVNLFTFKYQPLNLYISKAIFFLGALWVSSPLFVASKALFPAALKSFKMKSWRMVVNIRRYYGLTKINNFLLHVGAIGVFITGTLQVVFNTQISVLTYFTIMLLSTSFLLDIYHRVRFVISKVWKGTLGKIGLALYVSVALTISNFLARHWVVHVTKLEPKYFSEFINSFTIFFSPVAYLMITIILCFAIILPECAGLLFLLLFNPLKEGFFKKKFPSLVRLTVRMRTGKHQKNLTYQDLALMNSKIMVFRVLAAPFFLISIGYLITQVDSLSSDFFDKTGRLLLVNYYYHTQQNSKLSTMRYYKIDDSQTSVAVLKEGKWQFFTLEDDLK